MTFMFEEFPKIPRYKREVIVTEKLDGTNAQVTWFELSDETLLEVAKADPNCLGVYPGAENGDVALALYAGSRNRWLRPEKSFDNFGFAAWVREHADELKVLGPGRHFGEWFGAGIQRTYYLPEKHFALFNVARWNAENPNKPACCDIVPVPARGEDIDDEEIMEVLSREGSRMVPGFRDPEGIVVFHSASRQMYKRTFEQDGGKWRTLKVAA